MGRRRPKHSQWSPPEELSEWLNSGNAEGLPDWIETDEEDEIRELKEKLLKCTPTKVDILDCEAVVLGSRLVQLVTLPKEVQVGIISKLRRARGLEFVDAIVEGDSLLYVLLCEQEDVTPILEPADLKRTRLSFSGLDQRASSATGDTGRDPRPPLHLLGFCMLEVRVDPASNNPFNCVVFFETLCNGYNIGQLLYQHAGELCLARGATSPCGSLKGSLKSSPVRHTPAHKPTSSSWTAAERPPGRQPVAVEPAPDVLRPRSRTHRPGSLAAWPLPVAPKNIFYWTKLEERIPTLGGRGGLLRCFRDVSAKGLKSGMARTGKRGGVAATAAEDGSGGVAALAEELGGAFRDFCEEALDWDPAAVTAYLRTCTVTNSIAGEEAPAGPATAAAPSRWRLVLPGPELQVRWRRLRQRQGQASRALAATATWGAVAPCGVVTRTVAGPGDRPRPGNFRCVGVACLAGARVASRANALPPPCVSAPPVSGVARGSHGVGRVAAVPYVRRLKPRFLPAVGSMAGRWGVSRAAGRPQGFTLAL